MAPVHPLSELDADSATDRTAALLARVALGDRAAFAQLYQSTKSQLFSVVLRVVHDRNQAEDVLQEVYVNVWRGAHTYQSHRSPGTAWLVSVARYRAIDHARRSASMPTTVSSFMGGLDGDVQDALDTVASDDAGPQDRQDLAQQARALADCMRHLTAPQRQAVALAYMDGMTHAQAATHLQQPLGTIKSWVRRGLQSLQRCMGLDTTTSTSEATGGMTIVNANKGC
jgi:RNA polymerase sigma factor (sigma-70 family)